MKKIVLALLALSILIPMEAYAWVKISPLFWAPGVAYTQLGWGYVILALLFLFMPVAVVGAIFEKED